VEAYAGGYLTFMRLLSGCTSSLIETQLERRMHLLMTLEEEAL
jgi:hypothetical protein